MDCDMALGCVAKLGNVSGKELPYTWKIITKGKVVSEESFWRAVNILEKNFHALKGSQLFASVHWLSGKLGKPNNFETSNLELLKRMSFSTHEPEEKVLSSLASCGLKVMDSNNPELTDISIHRLVAKSERIKPKLLLTLTDRSLKWTIFLHLKNTDDTNEEEDILVYKFEYKDGEILLKHWQCNDKNCEWLKCQLFPKFLKWTMESGGHKNQGCVSLSLVSVMEYKELYMELKNKYGEDLVKNWSECTDPYKYVYEDIAIATYLLLLWKKQREEARADIEWKQTFVDLGCGNGLLVHILCSEGYSGKGIDVKKRDIWNRYPQTTKLEVGAIVPSDDFLFPEADWIIGNHSDELTPWIPVIASRSSYRCCYFVLPCCHYELDGSKYQRTNHSQSRYANYLNYVKSISELCGFETHKDRLRIPSTKRICLVGWKRTYESKDFMHVNNEVTNFISNKCKEKVCPIQDMDSHDKHSSMWVNEFKLREPQEKVRNCTLIDRDVVNKIVDLIVKHLLSQTHEITVSSKTGARKTWNAGGKVHLKDLAQIIPTDLLQQLKKECGGLQTLLKNNHWIFTVNEGKVQFKRSNENLRKRKRKKNNYKVTADRHKVKPCWFHFNHPDGCPLFEDCTFKH